MDVYETPFIDEMKVNVRGQIKDKQGQRIMKVRNN